MKTEKLVKKVFKEMYETESFICDTCDKVINGRSLPESWCHVEYYTSNYEVYQDDDLDYCSPECLFKNMHMLTGHDDVKIETSGEFIRALMEYIAKKKDMLTPEQIEEGARIYLKSLKFVDPHNRVDAFFEGANFANYFKPGLVADLKDISQERLDEIVKEWTKTSGQIIYKKAGWISTAERLPEPGQYVLIYVNNEVTMGYVTTALSDENRIEIEDIGENTVTKSVTHWMPLPEPPER